MDEMLVFRGTIAHSTENNPLEIIPDCLLGVSGKKIEFILSGKDQDTAAEKYDFDSASVRNLKPGEFLIPGFIDCHIHAPQYPNSALALDLPLLQWLNAYTFPMEAKYADTDFATEVYSRVVRKTLKNGTTTASYFATIHLESSLILANIVEKMGQRAYIGKVNMDRNSPDYYVEETERSLWDTHLFIKAVAEKKNPLVTPILTPRFLPSTRPSLLQGLAEIVKEYPNLPIQSHACETKPELKWVEELFPGKKSCALLRDYGLLNDKTVLAHGIYITDEELAILKEHGVGISHCPNSNLSICSGLLDARNVLDRGVKLGLGTDVSAGYSPSILDAQRLAVHTSSAKALERGDGYKRLCYKEAFRLATLGGAKALGLGDITGNFVKGKDFDALLINANVENSPFDLFGEEPSDTIQKFLHLGDDRNITEVYVAGKRVLP